MISNARARLNSTAQSGRRKRRKTIKGPVSRQTGLGARKKRSARKRRSTKRQPSGQFAGKKKKITKRKTPKKGKRKAPKRGHKIKKKKTLPKFLEF